MGAKLYEYVAVLEFRIVIAADTEAAADAEAYALNREWFETGHYLGDAEVELTDVRDPDPDLSLYQQAQFVLPATPEEGK